MKKKYICSFTILICLLFSSFFASNTTNLLWSNHSTKGIHCIDITPYGEYIATGSWGQKVNLYSKDGTLLWSNNVGGNVEEICIRANGSLIVASTSVSDNTIRDNKIYAFSKDGKLLWNYQADSQVYALSLSKDGPIIAAGSYNGILYILTLSGNLIKKYQLDSSIRDIKMNSDGSLIAVAGADRNIYLFSNDGRLLWAHQTNAQVQSIDITPNGEYIAAVTSGDYLTKEMAYGDWLDDGTVYLLSKEGNLIWKYKTGQGGLSVKISEDGNLIVIGTEIRSGTGTPKIYAFSNKGQNLWTYESISYVNSISICEDRRIIGAVTGTNGVYLLTYEGELLSQYMLSSTGSEILFSTNGSYMVTGDGYFSGEGNIYFYEMVNQNNEPIENNIYKYFYPVIIILLIIFSSIIPYLIFKNHRNKNIDNNINLYHINPDKKDITVTYMKAFDNLLDDEIMAFLFAKKNVVVNKEEIIKMFGEKTVYSLINKGYLIEK